MNSLGAGGNIYGGGRSTSASSRVHGRPVLAAPAGTQEHHGPPRWLCLECRKDTPTTTGGDPMRTDRNAVPTSPCPGCGAEAWIDANAPDVQQRISAIDAFERGQLRRPWARIVARGAVSAGAAWVFAGAIGLAVTDSTTSVFGAVVLMVTALLLVGVWVVTSSGYKPALRPSRTRRRGRISGA
jgi:hypothetical protein